MINQFESLISGVLSDKYGYQDNFLEEDMVAGLRTKLMAHHQNGEMKPAGIGRQGDFQENKDIRRDVIRWIEEDSGDPFEQAFFQKVQQFIQYLNRTCYTSINASEFHYAYYGPGSFYKRHLDQFKSDSGRKFSFVFYLNEDWKAADGGQIVLYPEGSNKEALLPVGGRAVFFKADELEHEVQPSDNRYRLSIAGWLKSI